ncbi:hypothetical protein YC2023_071937 [Brassica napus]
MIRGIEDEMSSTYSQTLNRTHIGCWSIKTAGRWSWKSKSGKECVTTHLSNQLAPKMDGAEVRDLYLVRQGKSQASMSWRVHRSMQNLGLKPGRSGRRRKSWW